MKTMFYFLLFMALFQIAAVAIAYTGFFGANVLYGDIVSEDPNEIISTENILQNLWYNPVDDRLPGFDIPLIGRIEFNWTFLTIGMFAFALLIGRVMHAVPSIIAAAVVGSIFLLMYVNSKKAFESIYMNLDSVALYIVAMIGVGFFFIALITILDYLSNQSAAGGR